MPPLRPLHYGRGDISNLAVVFVKENKAIACFPEDPPRRPGAQKSIRAVPGVWAGDRHLGTWCSTLRAVGGILEVFGSNCQQIWGSVFFEGTLLLDTPPFFPGSFFLRQPSDPQAKQLVLKRMMKIIGKQPLDFLGRGRFKGDFYCNLLGDTLDPQPYEAAVFEGALLGVGLQGNPMLPHAENIGPHMGLCFFTVSVL